jgi:LPXTG-motif cell wall-anchored protein
MKKKVFALTIAAVITITSAVPTLEATSRRSPANVTITPTPSVKVRATATPKKSGRSPKTGEVDYVLYGGLGAAAFASVAVISKKKKDEAEA